MTNEKPQETGETISLTQTWASTLPMLLLVYENGTAEGKAKALAELERMAKVADLAVEGLREDKI